MWKATLLRVKPSENPEDHVVTFEADSRKAAMKHAKSLLDHPEVLSWRSYGDPELWGKEQLVVHELEEI